MTSKGHVTSDNNLIGQAVRPTVVTSQKRLEAIPRVIRMFSVLRTDGSLVSSTSGERALTRKTADPTGRVKARCGYSAPPDTPACEHTVYTNIRAI